MDLNTNQKETKQWAAEKLKSIGNRFVSIWAYDYNTFNDEKKFFDKIKREIDKFYFGIKAKVGCRWFSFFRQLLFVFFGIDMIDHLLRLGAFMHYIGATKKRCLKMTGKILALLLYYSAWAMLAMSFFLGIPNPLFYSAIIFVALYNIVTFVISRCWALLIHDDETTNNHNQSIALSEKYFKDFYQAYNIYFNEKNIGDNENEKLVFEINKDEWDNVKDIEIKLNESNKDYINI